MEARDVLGLLSLSSESSLSDFSFKNEIPPSSWTGTLEELLLDGPSQAPSLLLSTDNLLATGTANSSIGVPLLPIPLTLLWKCSSIPTYKHFICLFNLQMALPAHSPVDPSLMTVLNAQPPAPTAHRTYSVTIHIWVSLHINMPASQRQTLWHISVPENLIHHVNQQYYIFPNVMIRLIRSQLQRGGSMVIQDAIWNNDATLVSSPLLAIISDGTRSFGCIGNLLSCPQDATLLSAFVTVDDHSPHNYHYFYSNIGYSPEQSEHRHFEVGIITNNQEPQSHQSRLVLYNTPSATSCCQLNGASGPSVPESQMPLMTSVPGVTANIGHSQPLYLSRLDPHPLDLPLVAPILPPIAFVPLIPPPTTSMPPIPPPIDSIPLQTYISSA
ncbi:hypothetical protein BDP27DRAFT_1424483 [Rhodocollybia butyracea]|uniref:Uncharacterized protein n=1 Tax=Rhodocollybia butyracea TaxID=206335 RepID=A0A9P5PPG0_9AGAR|nr:hypothetical protein BDP27DRAFT_1424483 [Rhodocollybia butyracea]